MSAKFPSAEILRRLGVDRPQLFDAAGERLVPTMTVLDMSRSIATEPVEARGYCRVAMQLFPGQLTTFQLRCLAPGGVLVERLVIISPGGLGGIATSVAVIPQSVALALPAAPAPISVGGLSVNSVPEIGPTVALQPGAALGIPYQVVDSFGFSSPFELGFNLYVRAGEVLIVQPGAASELQMAVAWRELPEIQAIP